MHEDALLVAINAQLVSFDESYRNAGVSRYTYTLLSGLSGLDVAQRYLVFINRAQQSAAEASALATSQRLELIPSGPRSTRPERRILWEQTALPGQLRRLGARVFHSPVNVLPTRLPCASVVTVHDLAFMRYPQHFRRTRRLYQRTLTRRSVRAATLTVAVSESTKRDLVELFGAPAERIRVIYPAIDADFQSQEDPAAIAEFRQRHDLPERYILFLGTLEPRKNLPVLLEAYARLRALDPEAPQLVLAGAKGWYYDEIFARARTLGIERHITFAGYVSRADQRLWYAGAELFVYPSVYEGFGLPVAEALACGIPTVTSSVSSLPEAGGSVARLVDPADPDALAHAMHEVWTDPSVRERTRAEGPKWARQFTSDRMATAYAEVYREAAELGAQATGKWRR